METIHNEPVAQRKKATIHQLTTMLFTSKNVLFPGNNHLLTAGADDLSLAGAWAIIEVMGHQHQWLASGYDLEIGHFLEVDSMVVSRWTVALLRSVFSKGYTDLHGET